MRFKKGEKKFGERQVRTLFDRVKKHTNYTTGTDDKRVCYVLLKTPITHWWAELVRLFALSVNRHSVKKKKNRILKKVK